MSNFVSWWGLNSEPLIEHSWCLGFERFSTAHLGSWTLWSYPGVWPARGRSRFMLLYSQECTYSSHVWSELWWIVTLRLRQEIFQRMHIFSPCALSCDISVLSCGLLSPCRAERF